MVNKYDQACHDTLTTLQQAAAVYRKAKEANLDARKARKAYRARAKRAKEPKGGAS